MSREIAGIWGSIVPYRREFKSVRSSSIAFLCSLLPAATLPLTGGCPPPTDDAVSGLVFNNTTDATNQGASYVGAAACSACHPSIAETSRLHGHAHALNHVQGQMPEYPPEGERAGVPGPPEGQTWNDVSYVIGGYQHGAFFVDRTGFVMTDGVEGVNTQWNLDFPPSGTAAGFVAYKPDQQTPLPYGHDCFRCHTTGSEPQDAGNPRSQDGRPGILGTWAEAGVQCEACHGPGSNHVPNPQARNIFVDSTVQTCARCHTRGDDPDVIVAADGFIRAGAQYAELRASGGHAGFACTICHDPHASTVYDRTNGIRNACTTCHADQNMARHAGKTFVRGSYVEELSCESCHMPFASKTAAAAAADIVGNNGRTGDTRTHIFRINTDSADSSVMFTADGSAVAKDSQGRAAVTVDFVCLRCHARSGEKDYPTYEGGDGTIAASGGLIRHHEQYDELQGIDPDNVAAGATGPHRNLPCTACHDPHNTVRYQDISGDSPGIKVECTSCHSGIQLRSSLMNVLVDCTDCHMPLLVKSAVSHASGGNGPTTGDIHAHIFRIDLSKTSQFTADGSAAYPWITGEFACLTCHNSDPDAESWLDLTRIDLSRYQAHE